jgi:hypothetical protein
MKEEIEELKNRLKIYEESPLEQGYKAILKQINTWNTDLTNEPTSLKYSPENGDADMKAFDKAHKFITSIDTLYDKLEYLRSKMNPELQVKVDQSTKKKDKSGTKAI